MFNALTIPQSVYRYRWLVYELVLRDLRLRYRGSVLGLAWTLLNPLIFTGIYTLVFGAFLHVGIEHYPVYLLAGLAPWMWFSGALQQGTTALVDGRMYVGKTIFPIEVLVLVPVLSHGWNFVCTVPIVLLAAALFKIHLTWALAALPLLALIEFFIIYALALLAASLYVFYRDVQQLVGYVLTAMIFMLPIFYGIRSVPPSFAFLMRGNPLAAVIVAFQDAIYRGQSPGLDALLFASFFALGTLIAAFHVFNRYRESFGEFV